MNALSNPLGNQNAATNPIEKAPLKIICIDDESNILQALKRTLRTESYEVVTTTSPEELLEQISTSAFAIMITDQRMPDIEGTKLLDIVKQVSPDTIRILLTGYTDITAATEAINRGSVYRFLTKPWDDDMLRLTLQQAMKDYSQGKDTKSSSERAKQKNSELSELNKILEVQLREKLQQIDQLNYQLNGALIESIKTMAFATKEHNTIIAAHSKRVALMATQIALQMNLPELQVNQIEAAALLHDIGESSLPSDILQKPELKRSSLERKIFEKHVLQGEAALRNMPNMNDIAQIVRSHHERYDGNGYPDMLVGEDIPLGARILAIADAYDKHMHAGYSQQNSEPREVLNALLRKAGFDFDPVILEVLKKLVETENHLMEIKSYEIEIQLREVQVGLKLSRDLVTQKGVLLLPKDSTIETIDLAQIVTFLRNDPPLGGIYVYRDSMP